MQDFQAAYNAEIEKALKAQMFPVEILPEFFNNYLQATLVYESRVTLGCDIETFKNIHLISQTERGALSMFEMGFILNAMERRTPSEWLARIDYLEAMGEVAHMTAKWNEIVTPIKNSIIKKLQTQAKISQGVPAGKQLIGKA